MGSKFTMRITSATWIYHHNTLYYSLPAVCVCVCGDSKEKGNSMFSSEFDTSFTFPYVRAAKVVVWT